MPSASQFASAGNAVDSLFGAIGSFQQAKGLKQASKMAHTNALIAEQSAKIQETQKAREIYGTLGGIRSDVAGAGLKQSGSALDIIRDSAAQGSLSKQLIRNQGAINVAGYEAEAANYASQAKAAKTSGIGSLISTGISVASMFFSDDRLKDDVVLVDRRPDGLGIYNFRYKGQPSVFRGVLASEVEKVYPNAVDRDSDGYMRVNYTLIGAEPLLVRAA